MSSAEAALNLPVRDDEKTMTILEHLQELRTRLMISAAAVLVSMVVSLFFLANKVIAWLKDPAESQVEDFQLIFTQPLEYWSVYFQVSLYTGIALAMPVLVWQFLAFVGPGLTRNEKKWAYPIVFMASFLFLCGAAFAYYVEMPPALNFLLDSNDNADALISIRSYIGFATKLIMVTGLVFETPILVVGLAKIGILTSKKVFGWWRYIIVGSFVVSAIVTPSIDPITQTMVAGPMIFLFFLGGIMAKFVEKNPIIPRA